MIENIIPRKMGISNVVAGYTKVYLAHTQYTDTDVQGKNYYIDNPTRTEKDTRLDRLYTVLTGFNANTAYNITGTFYDSFVDAELLAAKIGIEESDAVTITTKTSPTLSGYSVSSPQVDIGVGTPSISFTIAGDADRILIEKRKSGTSKWSFVFNGSKEDVIVAAINPGVYDFRLRGIIDLPDGTTEDISTYSTLSNISVAYQFQPPTAPTNLAFKVAKVMDGIERYDVKVEWDWAKGSGSNVREFVLYFISTDEYNNSTWTKAAVVNSGAAKSAVITGFPFNKEYKFKVEAVSWGPDSNSVTSSGTATLKVNSSTSLDTTFTNDTDIEVTYAHISAYKRINGVKKQTFKIDAATGLVSLGLLDSKGVAPISMDPTSGTMSIDGTVISKEIVSASFVLANLTGKDNPALRTSNKSGFGVGGDGMWAGYSSTDSKFKFDLGSAAQNIRWDGTNLVISGGVQIATSNGNVDIGTGAIGETGAGIYRQGVASLTAFNETAANTFFVNLRGSGAVEGDVLTQYNTADLSKTFTKSYNGTSWGTPALVVDGSIIATSTITADKLVADSAFLNKVGVNVIYDEAAAISANPESTYKMKIDLAAGSIHIR